MCQSDVKLRTFRKDTSETRPFIAFIKYMMVMFRPTTNYQSGDAINEHHVLIHS